MKLFGFFDKEDNSATNEDNRKKQGLAKLVIYSIVGLFILSILFVFDKKPEKQNIGNFSIFQEEKAVKTKWINEAERDLREQRKSLEIIEQNMKNLQAENIRLKQEMQQSKVAQKVLETQQKDTTELVRDDLYSNFPAPLRKELGLDNKK